MAKVLILGTGPLPIERAAYSYGSSNRTWHFAKGLLDKGHRVHAIAFRPMRTQDGREVPDPEHREYRDGELTLDSVDGVRHFYNDDFMRSRIDGFAPEVVVGVNAFPACRAAYLDTGLPLWADLNGFGMGEAQIRAQLTGDESAVSLAWQHEIAPLRRADVFSAASGPQRYALIGELAAIGRLRASTCGYEFVHVIPNAREDMPAIEEESSLRRELGGEAVLALWVGGYNYQFDVDSMFEGFEGAMAREPRLHFVSTGGKIDGHNEVSYARFLEKVSRSPRAERYHFLGWLPQEGFEILLRSCDVGVSMDAACYETELGARNRLTEMMRAGLPAITTEGPEIVREIRAAQAGWTVPVGGVDSLAEALLESASSLEERRVRGKNARDMFLEKYTIERSLTPLLRWVEAPQFAPDRKETVIRLPEFPPESARGGERGMLARLRGILFRSRERK